MKRGVIVVIAVAILTTIITQQSGSDEYLEHIEAFREGKHDFFENSQGSPFVQKGIVYDPVEFFSPDPKYKVSGRLERFSSRETLSVANSDGTTKNYIKFGRAKFDLGGKEHSLLILRQPGFGNQYLTAFLDETSGLSTYGGGRYLDLEIGKSDRIEIDFNKAYNPYCAYVPDYLCPLPPRENFLSVSIEAGEKDYKPL